MFHSPTYGELSLTDVRKKILDFMDESPDYQFQLVIGTDSQPKNGEGCDFITALIVRRIGAGGIYFWKRVVEKKKLVLRTRIYQEAVISLAFADEFLKMLKKDGITKYDVEIHVDIGKFGPTRDMIAEVVGMVRGSGFKVKTKPEAFGAACVADRHT